MNCASAAEYETAAAIWARIFASREGIDPSVQLSVPNLATLRAERALLRELLRQAYSCQEQSGWRAAVRSVLGDA